MPPPDPTPPPPSMDRHTYIPPHVQQAMDRHMQMSMPAHLKQYAQGNGYIPPEAQSAITQHLAGAAGGQYSQYADSFVQQRMGPQTTAPTAGSFQQPSQGPTGPGTLAHNAYDHFQAQPDAAAQMQPQPAAAPTAAPIAGAAYNFITDPETPKSRGLSLPGGNSTPIRAAFVVGGLAVLLIAFIFVKGLLAGSNNLTSFLTVAQDQQELIHLATNAAQQQGTDTATQNYAATAQLAIGSSQAGLIKYLATQHQKLNTKQLNLEVSTTLDTQLTAAAAATTYDQTFQQVTESQLNGYINDLKKAFQATKGPNGHVLLNSDYQQAQLMLVQISAPPSQ
jgi:hypothetical protein